MGVFCPQGKCHRKRAAALATQPRRALPGPGLGGKENGAMKPQTFRHGIRNRVERKEVMEASESTGAIPGTPPRYSIECSTPNRPQAYGTRESPERSRHAEDRNRHGGLARNARRPFRGARWHERIGEAVGWKPPPPPRRNRRWKGRGILDLQHGPEVRQPARVVPICHMRLERSDPEGCAGNREGTAKRKIRAVGPMMNPPYISDRPGRADGDGPPTRYEDEIRAPRMARLRSRGQDQPDRRQNMASGSPVTTGP